MRNRRKTMASCALVIVIVAIGMTGGSLLAQEKTAKGGASKLMELKPMKSKKDMARLEAGDTVAVCCPHCKQVWVSTVPKKGAEQLVKFQDEDKVVCPKCGSTEAFCCVGKPEKEKTD